jgi:NAD-dependent deacetylase
MRELAADPATVRRWIDAAERVDVLTGAGLSTESGITDFRGPQGLWTRDPDIRKKAWQSRLAHPAWDAQPNAGHAAIVALERRGKLHALITQNVDGLHQKAGSAEDLVIEVHGTVLSVVCMACGWKGPMRETLARIVAGESDPPCRLCGGILKSDTISFGQNLVPETIDRALAAAADADVLLAAGTSLQVYPIAGVVPLARDAGARIVIVNAQPTPFDSIADAVFREPIGITLPQILR